MKKVSLKLKTHPPACICHHFHQNNSFFISLETVADVDDVLGEMFLEEIQPTEEQLIVSIHVHVCTVQ